MKKLILVIDDDKITRILAYEFLKSENIEVLLADDGFSGLNLAKQLQPDLILCSLFMLGLDGYGVLKELREDLLTATIPFIFLVSETGFNVDNQAWLLGANDYLTKPLERSKLLRAINQHINFFYLA